MTVCKALIERCPVDEQAELLALLPLEERKSLEALPSATLPSKEGRGKDLLDRVHFSWMAPFLRTFGVQDLRLFLGALSKEQVEGLRLLLGFSMSLLELTAEAKNFTAHLLLTHLTRGEPLIPPQLIPTSALKPLLDLDQEGLRRLMRYLGLYDLAFEMKQIIATSEIKKILSCLKKEEKAFLQSLKNQSELLVFKRLFLQSWDETRATLLSLLEERGLQRLAVALYNQEKSLIWIIAHTLELPIATALLKLCKPPSEPRISSLLIQQILNLYSQGIL